MYLSKSSLLHGIEGAFADIHAQVPQACGDTRLEQTKLHFRPEESTSD